MNLSSHLSAQLGTLAPDIGGEEVLDLSGARHGGLPVCPNVILAASTIELTVLIARAREMADRSEILLLEYPEEGFTTTTDDEYRAAMAVVHSNDLIIRGCLVYGLRRQVNALTKSLRLWK
jgi:hypothetical protein